MAEFSSHSDVHAIAIAEMKKWGLISLGWNFAIDTGSRNGCCNTRTKMLTVTRDRVEYDDKDAVINTIRHEIAHALHYEQYVYAGREGEFYARSLRGRRWVRNVPPHGAEWKRIARKVGVSNPKSASKSNATSQRVTKWRLVIVTNGKIEDAEQGFQRFPKSLSRRYLRGQKNRTLGNLFVVKTTEWNKYLNGDIREPVLYQDRY